MAHTDSAEAYIVNRYKLWQNWHTRYDYKHRKGARLAQIIRDTGGLAPIALEIGVGPGGVAAALSRHGMRILGMDLSPDALVRAQEHCRADRVSLMRASGFSLPLRDGSLKLVYASQVLHLFDNADRSTLIREAWRVLQPGGRFIFDMKNALSHPVRFFRSSAERRRRNFPSQTEIADLLHAAGFATYSRRPGLLPLVGWSKVPNVGICRGLAHTHFYVATR